MCLEPTRWLALPVIVPDFPLLFYLRQKFQRKTFSRGGSEVISLGPLDGLGVEARIQVSGTTGLEEIRRTWVHQLWDHFGF